MPRKALRPQVIAQLRVLRESSLQWNIASEQLVRALAAQHHVKTVPMDALLETGDLRAGLIWAGQVQGLIHDTPTCEELVTRLVAETESLISGRLSAMIGPGGARNA